MIEFIQRHKKGVYILLAIYWALLFAFTSLPGKNVVQFGISDKIYHFTAYYILGIFLNLTFLLQKKILLLKKKSYLFTIAIIFLYAGLDEWHQYYIPGRSCDFYDWLSDALGVLTASATMCLIRAKLKNRASFSS